MVATKIRSFLLILTMVALAGCTPSTMLVGSHGDVQRCSAYGWGLGGIGMAMLIHSSCVSDLKKIGYVELPNVIIGIDAAWDEKYPHRLTQVVDPAESAGIKEGDLLISIDGKAIKTATDLMRILSSKNPGDNVSVLIEREGSDPATSALAVGQAVSPRKEIPDVKPGAQSSIHGGVDIGGTRRRLIIVVNLIAR